VGPAGSVARNQRRAKSLFERKPFRLTQHTVHIRLLKSQYARGRTDHQPRKLVPVRWWNLIGTMIVSVKRRADKGFGLR
jgi:hypothetical protein